MRLCENKPLLTCTSITGDTSMARTQKRTHSVRLDDDDLHELGALAVTEGRTLSELIRESVRTYLEMKSKRKFGVELTPESLRYLQWMIERGYINDMGYAVNVAVEQYLSTKVVEIEERHARRQRLDEWAREEKQVQI